MKSKHFFCIILLILLNCQIQSLTLKTRNYESEANFLGQSNEEKKLVVEVEPADYENDFIENLRDQETVDRRFGMDDLGMIIEKVTKNRYYPYPPTAPISGSQFMLPNLIGSPYLGPYTQGSPSQNPLRFKEKFEKNMLNDEKKESEEQSSDTIMKQNDKEMTKNDKNDGEIKSRFKEQIIDYDEKPSVLATNNTKETLERKPLKPENNTYIVEIEKKILKEKLENALKKLDELNQNAKELLYSKHNTSESINPPEEKTNNITQNAK